MRRLCDIGRVDLVMVRGVAMVMLFHVHQVHNQRSGRDFEFRQHVIFLRSTTITTAMSRLHTFSRNQHKRKLRQTLRCNKKEVACSVRLKHINCIQFKRYII